MNKFSLGAGLGLLPTITVSLPGIICPAVFGFPSVRLDLDQGRISVNKPGFCNKLGYGHWHSGYNESLFNAF